MEKKPQQKVINKNFSLIFFKLLEILLVSHLISSGKAPLMLLHMEKVQMVVIL